MSLYVEVSPDRQINVDDNRLIEYHCFPGYPGPKESRVDHGSLHLHVRSKRIRVNLTAADIACTPITSSKFQNTACFSSPQRLIRLILIVKGDGLEARRWNRVRLRSLILSLSSLAPKAASQCRVKDVTWQGCSTMLEWSP